MYLPTFPRRMAAVRHVQTDFRGYDHRPSCPEGGIYEMTNGSAADSPLFSTRPGRARIDGADGSITQLSLDAGTLQTRMTSAEGNVAALEQTVSDQGARIALVTDADGVNAAAIVTAINNGDSSIALSADKIDLNGITTVADTLHIGSQNSLERKYLIFHKSGAVISATRGDLPELMLSAGKIDLCGELYHNGEPLNL